MKHRFFLFFITLIFLLRLLSFFTVVDIFANGPLFKIVFRCMTDVCIIVGPLFLKRPNSIVKLKYKRLINLYLIFLGLALISLLYTTSFAVSFLQLMMYVESFVFSFFFIKLILLYEISDSKFFLKTVMYSIYIVVFIFFIGSFVLPEVFYRFTFTDSMNRLGGYLMNPNELGLLVVIGIAVFLGIYDFKKIIIKPLCLIILIISIYVLYQTFSRSSIIAFMCVCLIYFSFTKYHKLLYILGSFLIVPFIMFFQVLFSRGGNIEDVMTLTGRLPFWMDLINYVIPQNFFLGYGFQRIYFSDIYSSPNSYDAEMAHNTFLQLFLGLGFIGFSIGLLLTLSVFLKIKVIQNKGKRYALLSIFMPIIINSLTEFGIFGFYNFGVLFFQLLLIYISMKVEGGPIASKKIISC